ncbi:MAG: hypothetical protein R2788_07420 [Saprospiraceae bacterium]
MLTKLGMAQSAVGEIPKDSVPAGAGTPSTWWWRDCLSAPYKCINTVGVAASPPFSSQP